MLITALFHSIYCRGDWRISVENTHFVIEHQIAHLTRLAEEHHYAVIDIYSDIGLPGHDLTRPELNRMKRTAEEGISDAILVVNRDRLFMGNGQMHRCFRCRLSQQTGAHEHKEEHLR